MGKIRQAWQAFKKKYPAFEKHKNFKSDVGPQMDQYEAACLSCLKAADQFEKQLREMMKIGLSLHAALQGYKLVGRDVFPSGNEEFFHAHIAGNQLNFEVRKALSKFENGDKNFNVGLTN